MMLRDAHLNRCTLTGDEQFRLFLLCCCLQFAILCSADVEEIHADGRWHGDSSRILDNLEHYITYPHWLSPARHKRSHVGTEHPSEAEVKITAGGEDLILQLQKNQELFSPEYQEIWYDPTGIRQFSRPSNRDHCYYHGTIKGIQGSSVVLSTCAGLRGMITVNNSLSYMIEPLANQIHSQGHVMYNAQSLKLPVGTCGHLHGDDNNTESLQELIDVMAQPQRTNRERRDISSSMKYVELMLVADHAEFVKHGRDLERTKTKLLEAANFVDKYYKTLNIRVALIWLEIWNNHDKISVTDNPYSTLGAFLAWRRKQLPQLPNDNAQLVTGVPFQGTIIGLAPLKAMCSEYQSGGVNSDHSESAVGVAATIAHEMGHNFGMSHDSRDCCLAQPEDGGCIMAAATGDPFPRVFNPCNQKELKRYLSSGGGKCLFSPPNTRVMYGGQRCGNGYLEEGEECDCGEAEECSSPCCNAINCTLKIGAECSHGVCCHECKLKSPGVMCRPPSGSCDLPEYCDGKSESCPANLYLMDGCSCAGGKAYCYTGMCLTLEQQCLSLWGKDARTAPDLCFTKVNEAGDSFGNCGKDLMGKYRSCTDRNAKCGKIQCLSAASKPLESNAVSIDTNIRDGQQKILCRGTHVYSSGYSEESQGDTLDPGLVLTGTKCGENAICFEGECHNASFLQADDCNSKCHGHGLCNNNHNCHCNSGWAPPFCDKTGPGGSVDSGPVIAHSGLYLVLVLLILFFLLGLAVLAVCCCFCKHKPRPLKGSALPATQICINVPDSHQCKSHSTGHANSVFQPKKPHADEQQASPRASPTGPPRSRHSIVRPTVKPPPIPAYAVQNQSLQHSETSKTSPSIPSKTSPLPPNRPPPPCPMTKPSQTAETVPKNVLQVSPAMLQKRKSNLMPTTGHFQNVRFQREVYGKS
ncbi:disintegrin and metalloproteinase domain-containing protein 19-like isoform X1 [Myxocyprinus asiaticus]|uniref:disintegrin and metalloproteinase domain-containing protein 19-like isoform X1 n=1 Tax=Myxocyprinus asiaticus TaxID=70543 RepID=UPI002221DDB6|nr:disintegrin and metalloproteinase domain-containing protein 19-like isoform X1 [Myxocyprinus asiaticus]